MYNLQDSTIQSEGNGKAIFPLGISINNELTSVEKGESSNGNNYLKFTFTAESGATVSHFEWEIDAQREGQEKAAKKFKSQMTRIKHLMTKFVSAEQLPVATSFGEFADKIVATLAGKTEGKKFRIKTTYTWNDYVGIPAYVPFIESMDVPEAQTKLRITDFDKMEKEGAEAETDVAASLGNPAFGAPAASTANDDLPF